MIKTHLINPNDMQAHYTLSLQGEDCREHHYEQDQDEIDFCLECPKEDCNGYCARYRHFIAKKRKEKDGVTNEQR